MHLSPPDSTNILSPVSLRSIETKHFGRTVSLRRPCKSSCDADYAKGQSADSSGQCPCLVLGHASFQGSTLHALVCGYVEGSQAEERLSEPTVDGRQGSEGEVPDDVCKCGMPILDPVLRMRSPASRPPIAAASMGIMDVGAKSGKLALRADAEEFWPLSECRNSFSSQLFRHASDHLPNAQEGRYMSRQVSSWINVALNSHVL